MNIDFHPPKWFIYAAIALFSTLLCMIMMMTISSAFKQRGEAEKYKREEAVRGAKKNADSVYKAAEKKVETVTEQHMVDSIAYIESIRAIQKYYNKKKNELDAKYNSIDTITDNSSFGSFSVRQMLSDSAVQLYR